MMCLSSPFSPLAILSMSILVNVNRFFEYRRARQICIQTDSSFLWSFSIFWFEISLTSSGTFEAGRRWVILTEYQHPNEKFFVRANILNYSNISFIQIFQTTFLFEHYVEYMYMYICINIRYGESQEIVTIETLITNVTIEYLDSWTSLLPDN